MTVLSAQSIRRLCSEAEPWLPDEIIVPWAPAGSRLIPMTHPLITPFTERGVVNGKSYGLSACTYDCRIDQDLVLEPMPFGLLADLNQAAGNWADQARMAAAVKAVECRALASTMERFAIPDNVCGSVLDKSSYARVFVSAFNTHLDPGWDGYLTVELVNLGDAAVEYKAGDPVCQIKFEWLDQPTDLPYVGRKYSNQPARPVPAISEGG